MLKVKRLVWMIGCVSVMGGCTLYQSRDKQALSIRPVMEVKHAAGGSEAIYRLGRYYQGKVNYTEAIAAYEKALTTDPGHVEAHNGLGVSYSLQGQHQLALQHLRKAIALSPMATHLHNNLGYAHMVRGEKSEAAAAFEQALRFDPGNRQALSNLAAVYQKAGLHDKAAMLTVTRPESISAPAAMSAIALTPAPSATKSATVKTATVEKQEAQHGINARLVQVTPNIFEFRMTEADSMMAVLAGQIAGKLVAPQNSLNPDSKSARIEVSNGNGVTGMARQVAGFLEQSGFAKARLTDRQPLQQAQTEIHYRPGSYVLAGQIGQMMPKRTAMMESYNLRKDIEVRVLLGKDLASEVAYFDNRGKIQIARSTGKATAKEWASLNVAYTLRAALEGGSGRSLPVREPPLLIGEQ